MRKVLGEAIREGRLAHDPPLTQRDLARAVGVHQPSVSAWELGNTMPNTATMLTVAAVLQLDISALVDRSNPVRTRQPRLGSAAGTNDLWACVRRSVGHVP